jgi:hypothetical protein
MRRQATFSIASALLLVLDVIMAPMIALMAGFAADAPNPPAAVLNAIVGLLYVAIASVVCAVIGVIAGFMGASRWLVLVVAALPPLAVVALLAVIFTAGK